eukprot:2005463-Prymnesium_polylepis.1
MHGGLGYTSLPVTHAQVRQVRAARARDPLHARQGGVRQPVHEPCVAQPPRGGADPADLIR